PAFDAREPGVRENALRLAEPFLDDSERVVTRVKGSAFDPSPRVRFQTALSAGSLPPSDAGDVLAVILEQDASDPWTVTAALSSASQCGFDLLRVLTEREKPNIALVTRVAALAGAKGAESEIVQVLRKVAEGKLAAGVDAALLDGLGQGMRSGKTSLAAW